MGGGGGGGGGGVGWGGGGGGGGRGRGAHGPPIGQHEKITLKIAQHGRRAIYNSTLMN